MSPRGTSVLPDAEQARVRPAWNPQRSSPMPFARYRRDPRIFPGAVEPDERQWTDRPYHCAPLWASVDLRDGNQALVNPMDFDRKTAMFELLVGVGFKDIEVGYPSSSEADFSFIRSLVEWELIPDDVTVSVFTPARPELIDRTFAAIEGIDRGMVHLCIATACLWRDVVFGLSAGELEELAVSCAGQVARRANAMPGSRLRFEFSPETFNVTEPDYALRLSNRISSVWDACPDRPVTLNLPTTVETDSPTTFADQVEWMHRNLDRREAIILSVHPHNDRGTAVASAELAVRAGADRVEGTLFGNGERTGNVCLATMALNLFSQGDDPQLDFSDINDVRSRAEACNQLPVHPRHPYAGDLVYTAFSGTHQDAIAKGLADQASRARAMGLAERDVTWQVPYLPIDPHDVGRSYDAVVRLNSQSGKGGIAHVLQSRFGLRLPRALQIEFAGHVQATADRRQAELPPDDVLDAFLDEYAACDAPALVIKSITPDIAGTKVLVIRSDGRQDVLTVVGPDLGSAFAATLRRDGYDVDLVELTESVLTDSGDARVAMVATTTVQGVPVFGVAVEVDRDAAVLGALVAAVNRAGG